MKISRKSFAASLLSIFLVASVAHAQSSSSLVPAYFGESATTPHVLDISIVGDKYSNPNTFRLEVLRFETALLTYEPFKSHAKEIAFHLIENTDDLGCVSNTPTLTTHIFPSSCNIEAIDRVLKKAAVPTDKLVILVNGLYGGRGASIFAIAGNFERGAELVAVHELGHTLGLFDEYVAAGQMGVVDDTCTANCCHSSACTDWHDTPGAQCIPGCSYGNWYRSSDNSMMRNPGTDETFNTVSQAIINQHISEYTNSVAPTISLHAPQNNSVIHGYVTITTEAHHVPTAGPIKKIEIYVDDKLLDTTVFQGVFFVHAPSDSPVVTTNSRWDTTLLSAGSHHVLTAKAYDLGGNVGVSSPVSVTIDNATAQVAAVVTTSVHVFVPTDGGGKLAIAPTPEVSTPPSPPETIEFTHTLRRGMNGDEVKKLQTFLSTLTGIYPEGLVTGYFGAATESAVKKFQIQYGIASFGAGYGVVGPKTRTKLNDLLH